MNPIINDIYRHFGNGGKIKIKKINDNLYAIFAEIKYFDWRFTSALIARKNRNPIGATNTQTYTKAKYEHYSSNPDVKIDKIYYRQKRIGFLRP